MNKKKIDRLESDVIDAREQVVEVLAGDDIAELCQRAGVSYSMGSMIRRGMTKPKIETVIAILRAAK